MAFSFDHAFGRAFQKLSRNKLVLLAGDRVDAEKRETSGQAEGQLSLRCLKCLEEEDCQSRVCVSGMAKEGDELVVGMGSTRKLSPSLFLFSFFSFFLWGKKEGFLFHLEVGSLSGSLFPLSGVSSVSFKCKTYILGRFRSKISSSGNSKCN